MQASKAGQELQRAAIEYDVVGIDRCRYRAQIAVGADRQRTRVDFSAALVAVGGGKCQGACTRLSDETRAINRIIDAQCVSAFKYQHPVVDNRARAQTTGGTTITHLNTASRKCGAACVGRIACQGYGTRALLDPAHTGTGNLT